MNIATDDFEFSKDIFSPATPHYGFWTFNNGFGLISQEGYVRYDCTNNTVIESEGDKVEQFILDGQAIIQKMHKDLLAR
jgi:hypothetical protein